MLVCVHSGPLGVRMDPTDSQGPKRTTVGGAFVVEGHYSECPIELRPTVIYPHINALYQSGYVESTPQVLYWVIVLYIIHDY